MTNERKTEAIVRKLLKQNGYTSNENIIIEEQSSDNPKIDKLLESASKSGGGRGYPEFIVSFLHAPENLVIIECKAKVSKHESNDRKQYKDFAVDGVILYASYLKDHFNVMAIAVSGETERELKISHLLWLKGKRTYKDVTDQHLLNPQSLFNVINEQSKPIREEELIKKAIEYNETLQRYSIPEVERCALIGSILVALQDDVFVNSYRSHHTNKDSKQYNPNESLIDALLKSCETVLSKNEFAPDKQKVILGEYNKIKQSHTFKSKTITVKNVAQKNTILRDLIDDLNVNVLPYVHNNWFDVLGKFYTQFIRYAGSDKKTGLVLTPTHVTDLFCELSCLNEHDTVFDPCCGTGGFLVSAMQYMLNKSGNDVNNHQRIRSEQIIGVEVRADMFSHVCSNMMMRGDGKSHIHRGDCFDGSMKALVQKAKPTRVFLNPPYDKSEVEQLGFIKNAMECMEPNGYCVAICQLSTVVSSKKATIEVRSRLLNEHSLEAVLSMPDDLFHPIGVVTCILIFKAHAPHPKNKETFFGYFKDDGFVKVKHKGRINSNNAWSNIKQKWLDAYMNRKSIPGLSVMQKVKAKDEWCAEAYMETDYSTLSEKDFERTIKEYVAYKFLNGDGS